MKVLLLGEYSNVHNTLAIGLRELGHDVVLAHDGDYWKNYPRDIDLARKSLNKTDTLSFLFRLLLALPKMRNYDIVQLINPLFLQLCPERIYPIYKYLCKHNKKVVVMAAGVDYYYAYINSTLKPMRYSDYNIGNQDHCVQLAEEIRQEWMYGPKGDLCRYVAKTCDAIVACTYENWLPYTLTTDCDDIGMPLKNKLYSIPLPYQLSCPVRLSESEKLRVFIGISKKRSEYKGTDIMLQVAKDLMAKYPGKMELKVANGIPFDEYKHMMDTSDVVMDQIYSYEPGMNALLAMSKGLACMTGGEPDYYDWVGEKDCRPIINVRPNYESVYQELEKLILIPKDKLQLLKEQSREFVARNHEYKLIASKYVELYRSL